MADQNVNGGVTVETSDRAIQTGSEIPTKGKKKLSRIGAARRIMLDSETATCNTSAPKVVEEDDTMTVRVTHGFESRKVKDVAKEIAKPDQEVYIHTVKVVPTNKEDKSRTSETWKDLRNEELAKVFGG